MSMETIAHPNWDSGTDWRRPVWFDDGQPANDEAVYIEGMELYAQGLREQVRVLTALASGAEALLWRVERLVIEGQLHTAGHRFIRSHVSNWRREYAALAAAEEETMTSEGPGV